MEELFSWEFECYSGASELLPTKWNLVKQS